MPADSADHLTTFSTTDVAAADRDAYWSDILGRYFGRVEARSTGDVPSEAKISVRPLSFLSTFRVRGRDFQVRHDNQATDWSLNDGVKLILQVRGHCAIEQDGRTARSAPGGWLLYDPVRPYTVTNEGEVDQIILRIPRSRLFDGRFPRLPSAFAGDPGHANPAHSSMARIVSSFVWSCAGDAAPVNAGTADYLAETTIGLLRCQLNAEAGQRAADHGMADLLRLRAKQYILTHLADPTLTIDRVAAAMGCTKRYLHMAFEAEGTTLQRLIWRLRVERCREALADPEQIGRSISDIAFDWGFNSSAHFCRAFKAQIGASPTRFRRAYVN
jgi:AraC-like DNA-binding protein